MDLEKVGRDDWASSGLKLLAWFYLIASIISLVGLAIMFIDGKPNPDMQRFLRDNIILIIGVIGLFQMFLIFVLLMVVAAMGENLAAIRELASNQIVYLIAIRKNTQKHDLP